MTPERMVVVWRVTSRCNFGCAFCRFDRRQPWSRRDADPAGVYALGGRLAERRRATGLPMLVSWLGGEPYRWPPLIEVTRHFRHRLGLETGVTTNGSALASDAVRRHVVADLDELTVSIDGLGATHDRLRGWPGGFVYLRRAIGAIAEAAAGRDGGPLTRVNTVLMHDNVRELPGLCHELARWGVQEVTFNQLGGVDRPEFHARHHLRPEDVTWLARRLPELRNELAERGLRLRGSRSYLERLGASAAGRRLPVADCRPGKRFLFVTEDGIASPCSHTVATLGIRGEDVLAGSAVFADRAPACEDCPSTQVFGKFA